MVLLDRVLFCCVLFLFPFRLPLLPHLPSPRGCGQGHGHNSAPAFHHLITCSLHTPVSPLLGARLFRNQRWSLVPLNFIFRKSMITRSAIVSCLLTLVLSGSLCRGFLHLSVPSSARLTPCQLFRSVYPPAGPAEPWTVRLLIQAIRSLASAFLPRWDK